MVVSEKYRHITAAILAGGKSTRMQSDKAFLKLNDVTFIEHITNRLSTIFHDVIIISDHGERYKHLNIPVYPDFYKESGPLAGIHSAFMNTKSESLFIVMCDNPFINLEAIKYFVNYNFSEDALVYSKDENIQPLFGVYRRTCFPVLIKQLESRQLSALEFLKIIKTTIFTQKYLPFDIEDIFININTIEDYKMIIEKYDNR